MQGPVIKYRVVLFIIDDAMYERTGNKRSKSESDTVLSDDKIKFVSKPNGDSTILYKTSWFLGMKSRQFISNLLTAISKVAISQFMLLLELRAFNGEGTKQAVLDKFNEMNAMIFELNHSNVIPRETDNSN